MLTRPQNTAVTELVELDVTQIASGVYEYAVRLHDDVLFEDGGFSSVADALRAAAQECPESFFCEVSYAGIVAGTYWPKGLEASCEAVAELCVMNATTFRAD